MLYPIGFIEAVGVILLQMDFIGPRYIEGDNTPIHFLSIRYVRPCKKQLFFRIKSQTTNEVLRILSVVFFGLKMPLPDVVQIDNDATFRGCLDQKGMVGRFIRWWCHNGVIVIFNAPKSPWNTGSVEGANSVFDRKFWQPFHFTSIEEIDAKLSEFVEAYSDYHAGTALPKRALPRLRPLSKKLPDLPTLSQPFLFLMRIVRNDQFGNYTIEALNRYIELPAELKGQFVIVQINLVEQWMTVWQEREGHTALIRARQKFWIHTGGFRKKKEM